jgi:hypothetical protein
MNKKIMVLAAIGILAVIGLISLYINNSSIPGTRPASATGNQIQATGNPSTATAISPMQSTGMQFSQNKYFSKSHEIFPTLAADAGKALGAFSYAKEDLGNGIYRFTLTNNAEGYKGQSVTVSTGQSVYFIEPATGDDSASEDSITTDDILMAVDAQGMILK